MALIPFPQIDFPTVSAVNKKMQPPENFYLYKISEIILEKSRLSIPWGGIWRWDFPLATSASGTLGGVTGLATQGHAIDFTCLKDVKIAIVI